MHHTVASLADAPKAPILPLAKTKKVLYMTHLALGDYVYQGAFIKRLCDAYPNVQFDIWIDDCRTHKKDWHQGRNTALQQWLSLESHINHVYPIAHSANEQQQLIQDAQAQDYDYVIFVATNRVHSYLKVAKQIVSEDKVIGTQSGRLLDKIRYHNQYKSLAGSVSLKALKNIAHISDFYNLTFNQIFGISLNANERLRQIAIAQDVREKAASKIRLWQERHNLQSSKVIFINHLSTNAKRDWQISKVENLILQLAEKHPSALFIINTPPHQLKQVSNWCKENQQLKQVAVEPFSATENFFDLPAMMAECQLIISVETAIMHLASSLQLPQIALIRRSAKQWQPLHANKILFGEKRVDGITVDDVIPLANASLASA